MPALIKYWLIFYPKPLYVLQQILKEATKNKHAELEQLMYVNEIINSTLSLYQYRQILSTNYLVHGQLENKIHKLVSAENALTLKLELRKKAALLKKDLLQIKAVLPDCKTDNTFINFEDEPAALGALYVLEGATLGGNVIVKKIKAIPAFIPLDLNFYYYQVYGNNLVAFWKQFCATLNNQPLHVYNQITEGANKMFDYFIYVQKKNDTT